MPRLLCWCLLCFELLLVRVSLEQSYRSSARKLCGEHLLKRIVKLCGDVDWSHFDDNTPFKKQLVLQALKKVESAIPDQWESSLTTAGRRTHTVSTTASQEETTKMDLEIHSPPVYQYKKDFMLLNKTKEFAPSQDISSYVNEIVEFQDKNTNKVKTLRKLFWGNHPQRIRRGYSEKCCIKGCTEEELIIACLPYIDYTNLKKDKHPL
ncbi:insulin-like peptide INSL6 [Molossus nigricans]